MAAEAAPGPALGGLAVLPVGGLPEITPGADLAALIAAAVDLQDGDVVVVAQKVVSKAEGALVHLDPGEDRAAVRRRLVREQAVRVVAESPWVLIVETRHGLVCANAGIDASNVEPGTLALLPEDPDGSAAGLRAALGRITGAAVGVVVSDTFGRPWRMGQTDVAIGLAGVPALRNERGGRDRHGLMLEVTEVALADEVAAAADLVRRKADGVPVVVVRGLRWERDEGARAAHLQRPAAEDLFPRGRGALADLLAAPPEPVPPAGRDRAVGLQAGGPPSHEEVRRAVAAARRAGGDRVRVQVPPVIASPFTVLLEPVGDRPGDLVALGAAAATLRAALVDLGWVAEVGEPDAARRHRIAVRAGRPAGPPDRAADHPADHPAEHPAEHG